MLLQKPSGSSQTRGSGAIWQGAESDAEALAASNDAGSRPDEKPSPIDMFRRFPFRRRLLFNGLAPSLPPCARGGFLKTVRDARRNALRVAQKNGVDGFPSTPDFGLKRLRLDSFPD